MYPAADTPSPFDATAVASLITTHAGNKNGQNSITPATTPDADASITATVTGAGATTNTTSAHVPHGGGFTLTASATGFMPGARQWYRNNFSITGATASTYVVTSATAAAHAGAYSVALTTPAGEIVNSGAFTVTVGALAAPSITVPPVSQTVTAGANATFNVTASGDNLAYQWQKNNNGTWANIPGATGVSYTITNAQQSADAGSYRVVVSNAAGTATSAATLTVIGGNGEDKKSGGGGGAPGLLWLGAVAALLALRRAKRM
jgi:hypothetical protein